MSVRDLQHEDRLRREGLFGVDKLRIGDRVEANDDLFQGDGFILDKSTDPAKGLGTKLYPTYLVELDNGHKMWLNGISLKKLW